MTVKMKWFLVVATLLTVLLVTACSPETKKFEGASMNGPFEKTAAGESSYFTIPVKQAGDPVGIQFSGQFTSGSANVQLTDAQKKVVWSHPSGEGTFKLNQTLTDLPAGEYTLWITWPGPVNGQVSLIWKPYAITQPKVGALALVPGLGMLLVGMAYYVFAAQRKAGWRYLLLGSAAWAVTVALKFAWAIPMNPPIYKVLGNGFAFDVYVGALTGIFEVGITYLFLRKTRWGQASWNQAIGFGLAFGAVEAVVLSVSPLIAALVAMASPDLLPYQTLDSLAAFNLLTALSPVSERLFTVLVHLLSNVLIFYAIAARKPLAFWGAFLYKTAIDSVAAYAQLAGVANNQTLLLTIEVIVIVWGLLGLFGTRWLKKPYTGLTTPVESV